MSITRFTALVPNTSQTISRTTAPRPTGTAPTSSSAPTTPVTTPLPKPSPGTFRHPRLTEIISRQSRSSLSQSSIRTATINVAAIILSLVFGSDIHDLTTTILRSTLLHPSSATSLTSTLIWALRLLFLLNTILALRPIIPYISTQDNITDIPLTPSQRALLGLPPSTTTTPVSATTPNAGTTGYITPPRYQRSFSPTSSTPGSTDRRSISANYSSSPLSTSRYTLGFSPSPASPRRTASGSPFSGSPLFQKAVRHQHNTSQDNFDVSARSSLGPLNQSLYNSSVIASSPSPLSRGVGRSQSVKERGVRVAGSPGKGRSPVAVKGVNYKWLYDKGLSGPVGGRNGNGSEGMVRSESLQGF
jgi:nucleoporin POM34